MLVKVFAKTGEELYDIEIVDLDDLISLTRQSKCEETINGAYCQSIQFQVHNIKNKEYYSIEIDE